MRALEVAKALKKENVGVAVLHVPTIKPLDRATILKEAGRSGRLVVVAENHSVMGGLGEAVAELSERHRPEHRLRAAALQGRELVEGVRSDPDRSEEHTSELKSLMRISYAVFCLKKKH